MALGIDPKTVRRASLADFASRHGVLRVALFGSAARNELRPASDVDVVVELDAQSTVGLRRWACSSKSGWRTNSRRFLGGRSNWSLVTACVRM